MQAEKKKIEQLLKTARGQMDGLLKMVEENRYCVDICTQLSAAQAVLKKANRLILQAHMESCVKEAFTSGDAQQQEEKMKEIMLLMEKMAN